MSINMLEEIGAFHSKPGAAFIPFNPTAASCSRAPPATAALLYVKAVIEWCKWAKLHNPSIKRLLKHELAARPKGSMLPPDSWSSHNGYYLCLAVNLQELFNIDMEMPLLSDLSSRCLKCHPCLLRASPIWSFLSIYGGGKKTLDLSALISPGCQYPSESFWGHYFKLFSVCAGTGIQKLWLNRSH